ncbi:hypothetical protein [Mycobacterium sp. 155]|uniref:hypothetical protein n=1 Tax=Mycobacterium sp. 155 TaxID=1157943 RepID=UPI0012FC6701|nr:hypothetical protein [Mycobacterium sp. 155]
MTLNSILDNPAWSPTSGPNRVASVRVEREFFLVSEGGKGNFRSAAMLKPDTVYDFILYFNNDAKLGVAAAENTKLKVKFPGVIDGSLLVPATISADNAVPEFIGDTIILGSRERLTMEAVGDATIRWRNGKEMSVPPERLWQDGIKVGCGDLSGYLRSDESCAGQLELQLRTKSDRVDAQSTIDVNFDEDWADFTTARRVRVNDTIRLRLNYWNSGDNEAKNLVAEIPDTDSLDLEFLSGAWSDRVRVEHTLSEGLGQRRVSLGNYLPKESGFITVTWRIEDVLCGETVPLDANISGSKIQQITRTVWLYGECD